MQGKPPVGRKKKVTGKADESSMQLHGSGRTDGPVGSQNGYQDRKEQQSGQQQGRKTGASPLSGLFSGLGGQHSAQRPSGTGQSQQRPAGSQPAQFSSSSQQQNRAGSGSGGVLGSLLGGGSSKILIIVVIAVLLLGGGGLSNLFGGGDGGNGGSGVSGLLSSLTSGGLGSLASSFLGGQSFGDNGMDLGSLVGSVLGGDAANQVSAASSNSAYPVRNGELDRSVASGSRSKYTTIKGNGKDTFTVMVYMCGADLESKSAMGTKDLQEMVKATFGDNVRVIVQTGGSTSWHVKGISNTANQIYQVKSGSLVRLENNRGSEPMTNAGTLQSFIEYCKKNFSANRYALILWDHGCGSVSGYGYDENYPNNGSMSLAGLNQALSGANVKFDFIGFDACLMATVETALMASNYADYLIASEETEPGIGWYYTNWLTAVGSNTSMETLMIGKQICDDFVATCDSQCRGQKTTLAVIDLAELSHTVPSKLTAFSKSITSMISKKDYQSVSAARNGSREFAAGNRIDQVDLTDLCSNMDTKESKALAEALRSAVKYNRINNISDAHGLSVYFPYQSVSNVEKAAKTYSAIGMDDSYAAAIRAFAKVEASGQAVTGGTNTAVSSLFGSGSTSSGSGDMVSQLLSAFLGGGRSVNVKGLNNENSGFLSDATVSESELSQYLSANLLDPAQLVFMKDGDNWVMDLTMQQWVLVTDVVQNAFYDIGDGYVDLGLDSLFSFDEKGRMVADMDGTWLAINGQPVAYYSEGLEEADGAWYYYGRVPAELDGVRVDLIITLNAETGDGAIAGIRYAYADGETDAVAKTVTVEEYFEMLELDEDLHVISDSRINELPLVFLADKYDKNQNYEASYVFGNPTVLSLSGTEISNVELPDASKLLITYRITDIYNQHYWTPVVGK